MSFHLCPHLCESPGCSPQTATLSLTVYAVFGCLAVDTKGQQKSFFPVLVDVCRQPLLDTRFVNNTIVIRKQVRDFLPQVFFPSFLPPAFIARYTSIYIYIYCRENRTLRQKKERMMKSVGTFFLLLSVVFVDAFSPVKEPVSKLLQTYVTDIARLKEETQSVLEGSGSSFDAVPYNNDVFYLRYCLEDKGVDELKKNLQWRLGDGKKICDAAVSAFEKATAGKDKKWNNEPVRADAPYAATINQYITPSTTLTTSSSENDLVYCIRAGLIDDVALMSTLNSVDELVEFFLYCKEINALVANDRSLDLDKLLYVITVNDLNGLKLIGGDATFRSALSVASKQANELYPSLNGPTLLLNLPKIVSALVKLFTPLFPPEVNARLKFERGPLSKVDELMDVSYGGKDRDDFLKDLKDLCY